MPFLYPIIETKSITELKGKKIHIMTGLGQKECLCGHVPAPGYRHILGHKEEDLRIWFQQPFIEESLCRRCKKKALKTYEEDNVQ